MNTVLSASLQKEHNGEVNLLKRKSFYLEKVHCWKISTENIFCKYWWKKCKVSYRFLSNLNWFQWIFFWKSFCEGGLCSIVVISVEYSSFEVAFWTVRTLEFQIKSCCVVVNVLILLFCLIIFFQLDHQALICCINWK